MAGQLMGGPSSWHGGDDAQILEQASAWLEFRDEWRKRWGSDEDWLGRPRWFWRDIELGRAPDYFGGDEDYRVWAGGVTEDGRKLSEAELRAWARRDRADFDDLVSKCRRALEEGSP